MAIMVESVFVERGAQQWSQETLGPRDITHLLLSSRLRPESLNNLMSRPMSAFSRKYFLKSHKIYITLIKWHTGDYFFHKYCKTSTIYIYSIVKFSYSRESVLTQQLSQRFHQLEKGIRLKILDQPSDQHRARYSSEGSRGAVKDTTGDGSPRIQVKKLRFQLSI